MNASIPSCRQQAIRSPQSHSNDLLEGKEIDVIIDERDKKKGKQTDYVKRQYIILAI
jgi:hypothetical protein